MENFWGLLKNKRIHPRRFEIREQATQEITEYAEIFCNRTRKQARLGHCRLPLFSSMQIRRPLKPLNSVNSDWPQFNSGRFDECTHTLVGHDFQQQGVFHPAIDDVYVRYTAFGSIEC